MPTFKGKAKLPVFVYKLTFPSDLYTRLARRKSTSTRKPSSFQGQASQNQVSRYAWLTNIFSKQTSADTSNTKASPIVLSGPISQSDTFQDLDRTSLELGPVSSAWQLRRCSSLKRISAQSMVFSGEIRSPRLKQFQYVPLVIDLDSFKSIDFTTTELPATRFPHCPPSAKSFEVDPSPTTTMRLFIDSAIPCYFADSKSRVSTDILALTDCSPLSPTSDPRSPKTPSPRPASEFPRTSFIPQHERVHALRRKYENLSNIEPKVIHAKTILQNNITAMKTRSHNIRIPSQSMRCTISGTPVSENIRIMSEYWQKRSSVSTIGSRPGTAKSGMTVSSLQARIRACLRRPDTSCSNLSFMGISRWCY